METRLMLSPEEHNQLNDIFEYHAPSGNDIEKYRALRNRARWFAESIIALCPPSDDRTAAIRKVREALMTANASIALEGRSIT